MKNATVLLFFFLLSGFCYAQKKKAISDVEWKKISHADSIQNRFENGLLTLLPIDTTFVDSAFKQTFGMQMVWGEDVDKVSFLTNNTEPSISIKNIDFYFADRELFLAVIYYSSDKSSFYEKQYFDKGNVLIRFGNPRGLRMTNHSLNQFIAIAKRMYD